MPLKLQYTVRPINHYVLVFILLLISCLFKLGEVYAEHRDHFSAEWQGLLHTVNNKSEVQTDSFFLTKDRSARSEYTALVNKLRSSVGQDVACAFPARYTYVKTRLEIPSFDLSKCKELSDFIGTFHGKEISIALAAEYPNSPASAFGHIMLVFHNDATPEPDSNAIHFAAEVRADMGFFKYASHGLSGGFDGYYYREPLFIKENEYLNHDQRYLYYFQLKTSPEQRLRLIHHLYELRDKSFKYYFLNYNCAYRIDSLLSVLYARAVKENILFTLPKDVARAFEVDISGYFFKRPLAELALKSIQTLGPEQLNLFKAINSDGKGLDKADGHVLYASYNYQQYLFKGRKTPSKFYQEIVSANFKPINILLPKISNPINYKRSGRGQISLEKNQAEKTYGVINYRPVLIDKLDHQLYSAGETEQIFLETSLWVEETNIKLKMLNIISYKVMPIYSRFFPNLSWDIYSGIIRPNFNEKLTWSNRYGLGQTFRPYNSAFLNYTLGLCADVFSSERSLSACPNLRVYQYLGTKHKLIYELMVKEYFPRTAFYQTLAIIRNFREANLVFEYSNLDKKFEAFSLGVQYYF
jgi:hypothetical protein